VVLPVDDFPSSMTAGTLPHRFSLSAQTLRGLIDRTRFAISTEETRYYLNGIYLHAAGRRGHQGAARGRDRRPPAGPGRGAAARRRGSMPGVIIPRKTVNEAAQAAGRGDRQRRNRAVRHAHPVHHRHGALTSKLIDGTFPEYERVIPRGNDKVLRVGKKDFADAVGPRRGDQRRAVPAGEALAGQGSAGALRGQPRAGHGDRGAGRRAGGSYQFGPLEIGFQARYLNDITDQIKGKVEFVFADGAAPTLVRDRTIIRRSTC
jgi:DNA polymerase-3 subunit beta